MESDYSDRSRSPLTHSRPTALCTKEINGTPQLWLTHNGESACLPPEQHVFVALPLTTTSAGSYEDVFRFGIENPVRKCGYACERADQAHFRGDILWHIKDRIRTARFMIADLTASRPNVYLEVGYAWGCNVDVVLLARTEEELHFDVRGQKCIFYDTISQLNEDLLELIRAIYGRGNGNSRL